MSRRKVRLAVIVFLSAILTVFFSITTAQAQNADQLAKKGVTAYKAGNYQGAIHAFTHALATGVTRKKTGRTVLDAGPNLLPNP